MHAPGNVGPPKQCKSVSVGSSSRKGGGGHALAQAWAQLREQQQGGGGVHTTGVGPRLLQAATHRAGPPPPAKGMGSPAVQPMPLSWNHMLRPKVKAEGMSPCLGTLCRRFELKRWVRA
eukprot:342533-Chlamydomonas_euryale.AAC.1